MTQSGTAWTLLLAAALLLGGCTEQDAARVDCGVPGPGGVDCVVQRTGGEGALKACWELAIACANGGQMRSSACDELQAGESTVTTNLPVSSFSNQEGCDRPASGKVQKLEVTSL